MGIAGQWSCSIGVKIFRLAAAAAWELTSTPVYSELTGGSAGG